jgi:hypothetical protein
MFRFVVGEYARSRPYREQAMLSNIHFRSRRIPLHRHDHRTPGALPRQ